MTVAVRPDITAHEVAEGTIDFITFLQACDRPVDDAEARASWDEALNAIKVYVTALVAPDQEQAA